MIRHKARWFLAALLCLGFGMGAASCAPVSDDPPPSPAEAASEAERNAADLTRDSSSSGALEPADVAEIHDAAGNGKVEKIRSLININADLANATDNHGNTPLTWAAEAGRKDMAEMLLANYADINARNGYGFTPLHGMAQLGRNDAAELLLAHDTEADPRDNEGWTPLNRAAASGHKEIVEVLLAHGADVHAQNNEGFTPLITAAEWDNPDVVELLLAHNANIDAETKSGQTALHLAASRGSLRSVRLLLTRGAKVNVIGKNVGTPLHRVAWGREGLAKFFRNQQHAGDAGSSRRTQPPLGSDHEYLEIVRLLLARGADVNARQSREARGSQSFARPWGKR